MIRGKEYINGKIILDSILIEEIINEKRNVKEKAYDESGNLIFDGDFINDKRNGKGKEYNINQKNNISR